MLSRNGLYYHSGHTLVFNIKVAYFGVKRQLTTQPSPISAMTLIHGIACIVLIDTRVCLINHERIYYTVFIALYGLIVSR